jgi:hypothetical protein
MSGLKFIKYNRPKLACYAPVNPGFSNLVVAGPGFSRDRRILDRVLVFGNPITINYSPYYYRN